MADPLSIIAILGLVGVARNMKSNKTTENYEPYMDIENEEPYQNFVGTPPVQEPEFKHPQFGDITPDHRWVNGQPAQMITQQIPHMIDNLTNINNNLAPVPKTYVGPGIGVGADIPAYGGYQQLYRILPNNVNGYKLTALPGRSGPAWDHSGGRQTAAGTLTSYPTPKTAYLPERLPPGPGRSYAWGPTEQGEYTKSQIPGNRAETTSRCDGLGFGTANSVNSARVAAKLPSRNKGDLNIDVFDHLGRPTPNNSYYKSTGYEVSPEVLQGTSGIRIADKRGNPDRRPNPGRMNVRASAINQGGVLTSARNDQTRMDYRVGPVDGGRMQQYVKPTNNRLNQFKGRINDRSLNITKETISKNPFATQFYN